MKGNSHYADAEAPGKYYLNRNLAEGAEVIALGQVEATLALAFEQRTANLLAFYAMIPRGSTDSDTIALHQDILERLGLK